MKTQYVTVNGLSQNRLKEVFYSIKVIGKPKYVRAQILLGHNRFFEKHDIKQGTSFDTKQQAENMIKDFGKVGVWEWEENTRSEVFKNR